MMDAQFNAAELDAIALLQGAPGGTLARGDRVQRVGRLVLRNRHAFPDLQRREVARQRDRTADVIGIAVGEREVIEVPNASGAERGAEDAIADVEIAANRYAASV